MTTRLPFLALILAALPCTTRDAPAQNPGDTVRVPAFSVVPPAGKGWKRQVDAEKSHVVFVHQKHFGFSTVQVTTLTVFADSVLSTDLTGEEAVARDFLQRELKDMQGEEAMGEYKLQDVALSEDTVAGRRLHTLRYRQQMNAMRYGRRAVEAALQLWFPPDFDTTHRFYGFHAVEAFLRGSFRVHVDLTQVNPLIESFSPRPPAPGPAGGQPPAALQPAPGES